MGAQQFGTRTLFGLMIACSLTIVSFQFLISHSYLTIALSLVLALIPALCGAILIVLSALFAFCIVVTEQDQTFKRINLQQCIRMLIYGLFGFVPALILMSFALTN